MVAQVMQIKRAFAKRPPRKRSLGKRLGLAIEIRNRGLQAGALGGMDNGIVHPGRLVQKLDLGPLTDLTPARLERHTGFGFSRGRRFPDKDREAVEAQLPLPLEFEQVVLHKRVRTERQLSRLPIGIFLQGQRADSPPFVIQQDDLPLPLGPVAQ